MASKINRSAFFLSVAVSLIYGACWILFSHFLDTPFAYSAAHSIRHSALQCGVGCMYIFLPFLLVFLLMRAQISRLFLAEADLKTAHAALEDRVASRTAELKKSMDDIKTLKGIITICANCKSIRNGQNQWEPVESYIGRHTEAEFSHGLCRDCQNVLYGENYSRFQTITSGN